MKRYHVSESGRPGVCEATVRSCPRGGESDHATFDNAHEAQAWAEGKLAEQYGGSFAAPVRENPAKKWEAKMNEMYPISGYVLDNPFRPWDVETLEGALAVAEESKLARSVIADYAEKVNGLPTEELALMSASEKAIMMQVAAKIEAYDATPRRAAELASSAQHRARQETERAAWVARQEAEEAARVASMSPAQRWEEWAEEEGPMPGAIIEMDIRPGDEQSLARAIEAAPQSPKARAFIEEYREALYDPDRDPEWVTHHESTANAMRALIQQYDRTKATN